MCSHVRVGGGVLTLHPHKKCQRAYLFTASMLFRDIKKRECVCEREKEIERERERERERQTERDRERERVK